MSGDQSNFFDKIVQEIKRLENKDNVDGGEKDGHRYHYGYDGDAKMDSQYNNKSNDNSNIVIYSCSGLPGTGKSFVQDTINAYCRENDFPVKIIAPTNYVAYQQGGITINAEVKKFLWRVFRVGNFNIDGMIIDRVFSGKLRGREKQQWLRNDFLRAASIPTLTRCIKRCADRESLNSYFPKDDPPSNAVNVVLIDECSMITNVSLATLIASTPPRRKTIFVLFYGPNQLPPVSPGRDLKSCYLVDFGEYSPPDAHHALTQLQRFRSDQETNSAFKEFICHFNDNYFRSDGSDIIDLGAIRRFEEKIVIGGNLEDYKNLTEERILIVETNAKRQQENDYRLNTEGEGEIYEIPAKVHDDIPEDFDTYKQLGIDRLLKIRKGCVCFCRATLPPYLVKGIMLRVEDVETNEENYVVSISVSHLSDIDPKKHPFRLCRHTFETNYKDKSTRDKVAVIQQFPITAGYAITGHAAQGKTLNCKVGIDIDKSNKSSWELLTKIFFVAITRVRDPSQLYMDEHPALWILSDGNVAKIKNAEKRGMVSSDIQNLWENEYRYGKRKMICNNSNGSVDAETHDKIVSIYPKD